MTFSLDRLLVRYLDPCRPCRQGYIADTDSGFCTSAAEITMFDDVIVVYKFYGDLMFFVTGSQEENELIIYAVLQAFYESISLLLRCTPSSKHPACHSLLPLHVMQQAERLSFWVATSLVS